MSINFLRLANDIRYIKKGHSSINNNISIINGNMEEQNTNELSQSFMNNINITMNKEAIKSAIRKVPHISQYMKQKSRNWYYYNDNNYYN